MRRYVKVDLLDREEAIERIIREAVETERCVCWIRNTVADARRACVDLRRKYPSWTVDLFHSRFALSDRLDIEDRTVKAFGKQSSAEQRRGRVLIATQVVEQSLDVDFDAKNVSPLSTRGFPSCASHRRSPSPRSSILLQIHLHVLDERRADTH